MVGPSSGDKSLLGKIMDGMRSTSCPDCRGKGSIKGIDCPRCDGSGRISGELHADHHRVNEPCPQCMRPDKDGKLRPTGEFAGVTCFVCRGTKRRVRHFKQVNPAGISGTRYAGINEDPDPISVAIDNLVAGWMNHDATVWWHLVIMKEYAAGGTAEMKANRLGVSGAFFSVKLKEAHRAIEQKLTEIGL